MPACLPPGHGQCQARLPGRAAEPSGDLSLGLGSGMSPRCSSSSWASQGLQKAAGNSEMPPVTNHRREVSPDFEFLNGSSKAEDFFQMWAARCCYQHVLPSSWLFTTLLCPPAPHTHTEPGNCTRSSSVFSLHLPQQPWEGVCYPHFKD